MNSAEQKLLEFNPATEQDAVEKFQSIVDSLTSDEKKSLGRKFDVWKSSCLYYFLTNAKNKVGFSKTAPIIIQKYKECEAEANKSDKNLARFLCHPTYA
jgi:hypothetical protein